MSIFASFIDEMDKLAVEMPSPLVRIGPSSLHGEGIFATQDLPAGSDLGLALTQVKWTGNPDDDFVQTPMAKKTNHSDQPNIKAVQRGDKFYFVTSRPVKKGEEMTTDYWRLSIDVAKDFVRRR